MHPQVVQVDARRLRLEFAALRNHPINLSQLGREPPSYRVSSVRSHDYLFASPGHDHIDFAAAAFGTDQPLTPIRDRHFGAVAESLFGGIGLDLVTAIAAPNDEADAGRGRASERSGRP